MPVTASRANHPVRTHRLRSSARNMLRGRVTSIVHGQINAEVGLLVGERQVLDVIVTNQSVEDLGLHPGGEAVALIKSTFITLVEDVPGLRLSARNLIGGQIAELRTGGVEAEAIIDIGSDQQLVALVTSQSVRDMMLMRGSPVLCAVKASHIILAVDD